jgi:hypothetical protein
MSSQSLNPQLTTLNHPPSDRRLGGQPAPIALWPFNALNLERWTLDVEGLLANPTEGGSAA